MYYFFLTFFFLIILFFPLKKHKILQKLKSQKDIIITYPDKGNGIVTLNKSDYIKSMTELISDKKNF